MTFMVMNIMALDQGASAWSKEVILGGGIGIFGFAVLILFFGFCARKLRFFGFGIHCRQRSFHFLVFGSQCSSKILMSFRMWKSMWFSVFPNWVWVSLRSGRQLCASTDIEQLRNLCMLHLSLLRRIDQSGGFDNWDAKIYRFCMQFAVLMDFFFWRFWLILSTVLRFLIGPKAPLIQMQTHAAIRSIFRRNLGL